MAIKSGRGRNVKDLNRNNQPRVWVHEPANDGILKADNYAEGDIRISLHLVNEPDEIVKLKELALAQTIRTTFERTLLLKLKNRQTSTSKSIEEPR